MKGFTPGLFDRLLGVPQRGLANSTLSRMSIDDVKDAIARDLEALLNTRLAIPDGLLPAYPECSRSVVTYGLVDFSDRSLSSPTDRAYICSRIEQAIAQHEPRLSKVKALLEVREDGVSGLTFAITAVLVANASQVPVHFDAVLQPSTLQYSISKTGRAQAEGA